jgi:hypothetical protein
MGVKVHPVKIRLFHKKIKNKKFVKISFSSNGA